MKFNHILTTIAAMVGTLALGTAAYAADDLTAAQKTQVQGVIHDYLMQHPEVIIQAVQSMQQKQMEQMRTKGEEAAVKNKNSLFDQSGDPVAGNPKGKVSVVEFFDYQCPHCVDMDPVFLALLKANPDMRIVYKEFPIRGPVSTFAAKAALAANMQGKYTEMHEALMQSAKNLSEAKILDIAKSLGLNVDKLKADMDGSAIQQQIKNTYKLAQDLGIYGTPAIFVADTNLAKDTGVGSIDFIPGQVDQKYLQDAIDKVGKQAS